MTQGDFPLYRYRGRVTKVIDGDTVEVVLDLGLSCSRTIRVRIAGINAPELNSKDAEERRRGEAAKYHLTTLIGMAPVWLATHKDGKSFDRYVADLYVRWGEFVSVAELMVAAGHAVRV